MNLNKVILVGRVTKDPEMRTIPSGQNVTQFGLATNRVWNKDGQKQESTEFHNIVLWRRLAEIAGQYVKKGSLIMIEGHLQTRTWQGPDGSNRYRTEIVGESMQLGPRAAGQSYNGPASNSASSQSTTKQGPVDDTPTITLDEQGEPINDTNMPSQISDEPINPPETAMPF